MKKIKSNTIFYIIVALFIFVVTSMTVGFASYQQVLTSNGLLNINKTGTLEITNVSLLDSTNVTSNEPAINELTTSIDLTMENSDTYYAKYAITVVNNGNSDYIYSDTDFNSTITVNGTDSSNKVDYEITGIEEGETITSSQEKIFYITVNYSSNLTDSNNVNITFTINGTKESTGNLLVTASETTGNVQSPNTRTPLTLQVINTYQYNRTMTLSLSNNNFYIVDSSNNKVTSLTIGKEETKTYNLYIVPVDTAIFLTDTETTDILVYSNGISTITAGSMTISVDIYVEPDTTIPTVGSATLTRNTTKGSATADWSLIDEDGSSIKEYTINLYNDSNTLVKTVTSTSNTYTFTGLSEGNYYITVYGEDASGNTGKDYESSATTDNGYATKSSTVELKWTFSVTYTLTGLKTSGESSADLGTTYTAKLSKNGNYTSVPDTITVTMNGTTLTSGTDYTYSSGNISIPNVSGDITIEANGGCLVEGTKILLGNNTYKNIEDITYYDLLKVFNLDEGTTTKEYPIWIEKKGTTNTYKEITFSDGTILKVVGSHGVYSKDLNKFIDVEDTTNFHIGTNILEYKNNKLETVTVTNIETKYEEVNYYQVISTTYYNIISNNIITTDGHIDLLNIYDFKEDLTWNTNRQDILRDNNNLFTYKELSDIMPKYMFIGLRANETKYLLNKYNITNIDELKDKLFYINSNILTKYPTKNNIKYFIVSTSTNKTTKVKEDSYYKLPKDKNIKYWLNTTNNKKYKPGSKVKIELSTYFEAIK